MIELTILLCLIVLGMVLGMKLTIRKFKKNANEVHTVEGVKVIASDFYFKIIDEYCDYLNKLR